MSTVRARLMRRARHYLSVWQVKIGLDNAVGLTDINSEAEDFCCGLLNAMFDAGFVNMNLEKMNFPAIDLGDREKRLCVQVTSTAGAGKIDHTLDRFFSNELERDYDRLIVLILGKKQNHTKKFNVRDGFSFEVSRDVWDIPKLLAQLAGLDMQYLNRVDAYLEEQFGAVEELSAPMDLPILSALDEFSFLGRERELDQIARRFEENKQFVFLSGLGGMGKTELAVRFAQTRWGGESYFVGYTRSWKQTVLENIAPWIPNLNRENQDNERIYRDAMAVLRARSVEELLILDNADQEEASLTQLKRELSGLRMCVIVTTRTEYEHAIDVARLHRKELHRLFEQHEAEATEAERDALIDAVGGHTLTVDLMARALRPGRRAATAEKLLNNLSDSTIKKVDTAYPGGMKQARINEHLRTVFKVLELPEEETALLRCATLLPESGMSDALFLAPFEDQEAADDLLQSLIDKGWLIWKDDLLKIHPVVRLVCREELKPADENCGAFLSALIGRFDEDKFDQTEYRQMAQVLSEAAARTEDRTGRWALKAGEIWWQLGDLNGALNYSIKAMERAEKNLGQDTPEYAQAVNNVGMFYGEQGKYEKALEYELKALKIRERVLPGDHPELAESYNNVGSTYGALGDHQTALEYKQKDLEICERVLPGDHTDLAISYNNVGSTYGDLGDHQTALEYQRKALEIRERVLPGDHPDLARSYNNVGSTYGDLGDHKKALKYKLKDLEICERVLPGEHPDLAISYNNVGLTYGALGDHKKALAYELKALEIRERVLPKDHPDLALNYNNVGYTYGALGEHQKALAYELKALEIRERVLPKDHPDLALSCNNIAYTYACLDDFQKAAQYIRRAVEIGEKRLPEGHPSLEDYRQWRKLIEMLVKSREMGFPLPNPFKK